MKISNVLTYENRRPSDCTILPFWKEKEKVKTTIIIEEFQPIIKPVIASGDFQAKEGEILILYLDEKKEKRLLLLGLGSYEKLNLNSIKKSYAEIAKISSQKKIKHINVFLPLKCPLARSDLIRCASEGLLFANYRFDKLKHHALQKEPSTLLESICFVGIKEEDLKPVKKSQTIAEGVYLARDLINNNADTITPQKLGAVAKTLEKLSPKVKVEVFNKKRIEKERMGLLLAVSRAAAVEPKFIIIDYQGNLSSREKTVLIGKGVTFDSGGLDLKSSKSMEGMKADMAGAAIVLATLQVIMKLKFKVNVIAIIPAVENAIGSLSYKPGDVYKGMSGKTVEIVSTDAEGRLILADAIFYALTRFKPTRIIDLATLTGSILIALGEEVTGFFSNDEKLATKLEKAAKNTNELIWRLPLYKEYKEMLKSDIADIKNAGGRIAGSITAALFLEDFIGSVPWAHLDIAGSSFFSKDKGCYPKYATGIGVHLLVEFFEALMPRKER